MDLAKLIYKICNYLAAISISYIIAKPLNKYSFTSTNRHVVPHFNTYFMKHYCPRRFYSMECSAI